MRILSHNFADNTSSNADWLKGSETGPFSQCAGTVYSFSRQWGFIVYTYDLTVWQLISFLPMMTPNSLKGLLKSACRDGYKNILEVTKEHLSVSYQNIMACVDLYRAP